MARKQLSAAEVIEIFMEEGSDEEAELEFAEDLDLTADIMPDEEEVQVANLEVPEDEDSFVESRSSSNDLDSNSPTPRSTPSLDLASTPANGSPEHTVTVDDLLDVDLDLDDVDFDGIADDIAADPELGLDLDLGDPGLSDWVRNTENFPMAPPFTGQSGFQVDMPVDATPLQFYQLFITDRMIKAFKAETNRYAASVCREAQRRNPNLSPRSFFRKWKTVTEGDMMVFIAILIHMGVVDKPTVQDYWSTHPVLSTTFAPRHMKRDRFRMILSFFHLNDNSTYVPANTEGHDPLHKIRPFYDSLRRTFKETYLPDENICIDEAMCPWRGRVGFRVYMKDKPIKWGIKLYELCESASGYVWDFEIWCRAPNVSNSPRDVCLRLLEPLHSEGRTLFIDNYYCCPLLAHELIAENTNVVGTVRANRVGMPKDLRTNLATGEIDYRRNNQVLALRWKDKREVTLLTTKHLPTMREVVSRAETKMKPDVVIDYTKFMKGVDHSDQMVSYLPLHRKTLKWWKKLTFHLLTLVMVQAHCLYNKHRRVHRLSTMNLERFVITVALQLIVKSRVSADPGVNGAAVPPQQDTNRLTGKHWMELCTDEEGKTVRRACKVCYAKAQRSGASRTQLKNQRKTTMYSCKTCKAPLCVVPCMEIYHTVQDFGQN